MNTNVIAAAPQAAPMPSQWDGVWIAIPAYNEERTIRAVAEAALARCPRVIVVDDGSSDATVSRLEGLPITRLRHGVNAGKAASLRTAFSHAIAHDAEAVVTVDGDGQHDPADLDRLVAAWRASPERIVIGARLHDRAAFPRARYLANRFACLWISLAAGHAIADSQSGFRVYPRAVLDLATGRRVRSGRFTMESEILIEAARVGHRTTAVEIAARYPADRRGSHYSPVLDTLRIVAMVGGRLLAAWLLPGRRADARARPERGFAIGALVRGRALDRTGSGD